MKKVNRVDWDRFKGLTKKLIRFKARLRQRGGWQNRGSATSLLGSGEGGINGKWK